jgi:hypothetical protein
VSISRREITLTHRRDRRRTAVLRTRRGIEQHLPTPVSLLTLLRLASWPTCVACLLNGRPPSWAIPRIGILYTLRSAIHSNGGNDCSTWLFWADFCVFDGCVFFVWLGMATIYYTSSHVACLHVPNVVSYMMSKIASRPRISPISRCASYWYPRQRQHPSERRRQSLEDGWVYDEVVNTKNCIEIWVHSAVLCVNRMRPESNARPWLPQP